MDLETFKLTEENAGLRKAMKILNKRYVRNIRQLNQVRIQRNFVLMLYTISIIVIVINLVLVRLN